MTSKMKLTDIELLAALENLRIGYQYRDIDDYTIRIVSAIVAKNLGYKDRAEWTEKVSESGLVKYEICDDTEAARANYLRLMEKLDKGENEQ